MANLDLDRSDRLCQMQEIDPFIKLVDFWCGFHEHVQCKKQVASQNSFVGNGAHYEYQLELMTIKHLEDQHI